MMLTFDFVQLISRCCAEVCVGVLNNAFKVELNNSKGLVDGINLAFVVGIFAFLLRYIGSKFYYPNNIPELVIDRIVRGLNPYFVAVFSYAAIFTAAVLTVTAVHGNAGNFVTASPTGAALPLASNLSIDLINRQIVYGGQLSSFWVPLSQAIVSGLTFATLLTLIATPAMLALPHHFRVFKRYLMRKWRRADRAAADEPGQTYPR